MTALHLAVKAKKDVLVIVLLDSNAGAGPLAEMKDHAGRNVFHFAASAGNTTAQNAVGTY